MEIAVPLSAFYKRRHRGIGLALFVLAIPLTFTPFALNVRDFYLKQGAEHGQEDIFRLQGAFEQMRSDATIIRDWEKATDKFVAQSPITDLNDYFDRKDQGEKLKNFWVRLRSELGYSQYGQWAGTALENYRQRQDAVEFKLSDLDQQASARYSLWEIRDAGQEYKRHNGGWYTPPTKWDYAKMVGLVVLGYLGLCLWVGIVYLLPKLIFNNFRLWCELCSFRLPLAALFHPLMLGFYPWGDPRQQLRRALQTVAGMLSFAMPFGVSIAASAQGCPQRNTNPADGSNNLVLEQGFTSFDLEAPVVVSAKACDDSQQPKTPPPVVEQRPSAKAVTFHGYFELDSRYVGMNTAVFWNYPALQDQVVAMINRGWFKNTYGAVFTSAALTNRDRPGKIFGNELDLKIGHTENLSYGFALDFGANYVNVSPLWRMKNGDVVQIYATGSRKFQATEHQTFTPYVGFNHFAPLSVDGPHHGSITQIGTTYSWQHHSLNLTAKAEAEFDNRAFGFDRAWLLRTVLDPGFKTRGNLTIHPAAIYFTAPVTTVRDGRKPTFAFGPRLTF